MKNCAFKFRVTGGTFNGKFVLNLEEGTELYLDGTFQPFTKDSPHTCFFLEIKGGRAILKVLKPDVRWNDQPIEAQTAGVLHAGHVLRVGTAQVDILECPDTDHETRERARPAPLPAAVSSSEDLQTLRDSDITKALDIGALRAQLPKTVMEEPTRRHRDPTIWVLTGAAFAGGLLCGFFLGSPELWVGKQEHTVAMQVEVPAVPNEVRSHVAVATPAPAPTPEPVAAQAEPAPSAAPLAAADPQPLPVTEVKDLPATPVAPVHAPLPAPSASAAPADPTKAKAFLVAIERNLLKEVIRGVEAGDYVLTTLDEEGRNPLVRAAAYGHVSMVKFFAVKGVSIHATDRTGATALHWAVQNKRDRTAEYLVDSGADPSFARADGKTALALAKEQGNAKLEQKFQGAQRSPASQAR